MTMPTQVLGRLLGPSVVVDKNRSGVQPFGSTVQEDHRCSHCREKRVVGQEGSDDDAGDASRQKAVDDPLLFPGIARVRGHEHLDPALESGSLDFFDHACEERVTDSGDHHGDGLVHTGAQGAGEDIHLVPELVHRVLHPTPRVVGYPRITVEHPRRRLGAGARALGNISQADGLRTHRAPTASTSATPISAAMCSARDRSTPPARTTSHEVLAQATPKPTAAGKSTSRPDSIS